MLCDIGGVLAGATYITVTVSPRADGDTNTNADAPGPITCYQGCYFNTDGNEYELTATGSTTNVTTWLDSGNASDVWVEFVYTSGDKTAWDTHADSTRYQLNSNQQFQFTTTRPSGAGSGTTTDTLTGYFRMWDAASGGNVLWTGSTVSWVANAQIL